MGSIAMTKSRVLSVGCGGIGTMAAYTLEAGGLAEVTAVLRSNYSIVCKSGFTIDAIELGKGIKGWKPTQVLENVPNVAEEKIPPFDFIVVATKNVPDVSPTVLDIITPAITPGETTVVLLQNGLNIEKPIAERFPENVVLSGVTLMGATETAKGVVRQDDTDTSKIGPFPGLKVSASRAEAAGRRFVDIYNGCGKVDCTYDDNVLYTRWRKLVYNSSFNSVAAVLGMDVIRMRMTQHVIDELVKPIMLEIKTVAKAAGAELQDGVEDFFIMVDPPDGWFMPSMGQDAVKGNYVEMETIVGEPVREARRLGVPTPKLEAVYSLLKGQQMMTKEAKGAWKPHFAKGNPYAA
ncbi:putative 2-dehydropantoate 2-reductase [Polychaeton citri CBS 116435]|uniref:2-dehydropantoate 2-reductase n=1 Tax=Polychaeton citri CBS 116435 TaxID=1314669 RepID=A0A9P4ULV5_9PEZI|nr:putative 2-dehydropantoate 2-reductase [Polychaeton citri CBS 116435]